MLERATARTLPLVNRASEYAPVAPACCNVCRTCTAANFVGLVMGALVAVGAVIGRLLQPRRSGIRLPS
jgi:hypothetical protein